MSTIKFDLSSFDIHQEIQAIDVVIRERFPFVLPTENFQEHLFFTTGMAEKLRQRFGENGYTYVCPPIGEGPAYIVIDTDALWTRWSNAIRFRDEDDCFAAELML
jgi:hypothetical protein